jgi:hypothetical protein
VRIGAAVNGSTGVVTLTNALSGAFGNQAIQSTVTASGFSVAGMSGGGAASCPAGTKCKATNDCIPGTVCGAGNTCQAQVFALTTVLAGAGAGKGNVTADVGAIDCGSTCSDSYPAGTLVVLTATSTSPASFTGWSGDCNGPSPTCTVTMSQARNVTATFTNVTYQLKVTHSGPGGTVSDGATLTCPGTCAVSYNAGTVVTLTATDGASAVFSAWSGDCTGGSYTCPVTMSSAKNVTGTFVAGSTLTVTNISSGGGTGTVSDGAKINCGAACSALYATGSNLTLTATPDATSFVTWAGCTSVVGNTCHVTLSAAKTVTATFAPTSVSVILAGSGGGSVASTPPGISCPGTCSATFNAGASVQLDATPDGNSTFGHWSGDCTGPVTPCTVTADKARSVTATFDPIPETVSVTIVGAGTVTSVPSGISCSSGTCNATFNKGDDVKLTAAPTGAGVFQGWTGDYVFPSGICEFNPLNANKSVTATFNP